MTILQIFSFLLLSCYAVGSLQAQGEPLDSGMVCFTYEKEPEPIDFKLWRQSIGYPPAAFWGGLTGRVVVRVKIDEQGAYLRHVVISDPASLLTEAVTSKVSQLRFTPALSDGKPIKCWVTLPITFQTPGSDSAEQRPLEGKHNFYSLAEALAAPDPTVVRSLRLNSQGLKTLPPEILGLKYLEVLELRDNALTELPADLAKLPHLHYLDVTGNRLSAFPRRFLSMAPLKVVLVGGNQFTAAQRKAMEEEFGGLLYPKDRLDHVQW